MGPDYRSPATPTPDNWQSAAAAAPAAPDAAALASWWTTLNDALLSEFIEQALARSPTVAEARARLAEARARYGIASAGLFPGVDAAAGVSRNDSDARDDGTGSIASAGNGDKTYSAGLDASWELDLFGGNRRSLEAATAQLGATEADLRDVLVTLLGDVALGYTNVRTAQSRLTFAERNLEAQRSTLDIAHFRAQAGLATVLDVDQAKSSYEQTRAAIPSLESNLEAAMNRLAVLTGQQPGALRER